jgi:N-acetylmuramoyl-L-alanine amidase
MDFSARISRFVSGLICFTALVAVAEPGFIDRDLVEPGVYAVLRNGQVIFLECNPPSGNQARGFFEKYLADAGAWRMYVDKGAVAISFASLCPDAQRKVLLALFPLDYIDDAGWWHTVRMQTQDSTESIDAIAEWLTGSSSATRQIMRHEANRAIREPLKRGDRILVPQPLLLPVMKKHKALPPPPVVSTPTAPEPKRKSANLAEDGKATPGIAFPFVNGNAEGLLEYREDQQGRHAIYKLQKGESLYSAVVVRFTDYGENSDILDACDVIAKRSDIKNVHRIRPGQRILIPIEMLSDRFQPEGTEQRESYDDIRAEERRLEKDRVRSHDLDGIVIILDPGHGGRDRGAAIEKLDLYEDEINYDIVCRIKTLLEAQTRAQIHVTAYDPNQGYTSTDSERFVHDTDEILNMTPIYNNQDAKISANLRWHLANDIYYQAHSQGVDERKILFVSIHCDALFNETLRGAMVYVPGLKYRSDPDISTSGIYGRFEEVKRNSSIKTSIEERRRDEALSRIFASTLLNAMRGNTPPLKVHDAGDPVRNVIRQSGGKAYLPAVLRYNVVPTKVLVEIANMTNPQDQQRLADPQWRQWFAESFVMALRGYYNQ